MFEERPPTVTGLPPAVTAVVPTHHRPARMREAVQSIVDQSYPGAIEPGYRCRESRTVWLTPL